MATGDRADFVSRMRAVMPARWFPDDAPVLTGLLSGIAEVWATIYAMLQFVRMQARLATATGVFLDMASVDFFGAWLPRAGMSDVSFRLAIMRRILRQCGTRAGIAAELHRVTGAEPRLIEGWRAADCGAFGGGPVLIGYAGGGTGYSTTRTSAGAGCWGTRRAAQAFADAAHGSASAADTYATVMDMRAAGVNAWVAAH